MAEVGEVRRYFFHPESSCLFTQGLSEPTPDDGLTEELTFEQYCRLKQQDGFSIAIAKAKKRLQEQIDLLDSRYESSLKDTLHDIVVEALEIEWEAEDGVG